MSRVRWRESVRSQPALMKNSINQRERYFPPLDVEMIDFLSTLAVLCARVQWIMRHRFRQKRNFFSPTVLAAAWMSIFIEVTDTKRAILSVHEGCASTPGFDIVSDRELTCWTWMSMTEYMLTMRGNSLNTILDSVFLSFVKSNGK